MHLPRCKHQRKSVWPMGIRSKRDGPDADRPDGITAPTGRFCRSVERKTGKTNFYADDNRKFHSKFDAGCRLTHSQHRRFVCHFGNNSHPQRNVLRPKIFPNGIQLGLVSGRGTSQTLQSPRNSGNVVLGAAFLHNPIPAPGHRNPTGCVDLIAIRLSGGLAVR